ncbi:MAG: ribonuclease E/G [Rickettsiales bacterium]|nr:ribonuclease E/G [Rickettsiales bacterium]
MTKRMLIDAEYINETRVIVTNNDELIDFDHETARKKQNRGNLYLAKIARVEPSLQAAFVDYGNEKHGFLAFSEIHPDYFQIPVADREIILQKENESNQTDTSELDEDDNIAEKKSSLKKQKAIKNYKIQEVIKKGQIILIQVTKEERGNKGAAMTTFISLAGRYCVLMPNTIRKGGISRRITNISDRKNIRSIIEGLKIPDSMAIIVRTAGSKRTKLEIKRDFSALIKSWEKIKKTTLKSVAPILVHEENNIIKRAIRDLYDGDIKEILVEGIDTYKEARNFMKTLIPSQVKIIKQYKETIPLLKKFRMAEKLEKIHSPIAKLPSGGYLVINQTEALVAVDVNSGRATKERNIEQTALQTNKEAAEELAIQLRLRDLSGLIVVDFIDMTIHKNNRAIENILKQSLYSDRAKIQVGSISNFGLLEMSRQRLRPSIYEADFTTCENCNGTGRVRSIESLTLKALHDIEEVAANSKKSNIRIDMPENTAINILNNKRKEIAIIEEKRKINITIVPNNSINDINEENLKEEKTKPKPAKNTKKQNIIKRKNNVKNNIRTKKDYTKDINENNTAKKGITEVKENIVKNVIKNKKAAPKKDKEPKTSTKINIDKDKNEVVSNKKNIETEKKETKTKKAKNEKNIDKKIKRKKGPKKTGWWNKETE